MNITLHIERLVIDGALDASDTAQLQADVVAQLTQLLAEGGLSPELAAGGAVPSRRGGTISMGGSAQAIGSQIGAAVYGSIGNAQKPSERA